MTNKIMKTFETFLAWCEVYGPAPQGKFGKIEFKLIEMKVRGKNRHYNGEMHMLRVEALDGPIGHYSEPVNGSLELREDHAQWPNLYGKVVPGRRQWAYDRVCYDPVKRNRLLAIREREDAINHELEALQKEKKSYQINFNSVTQAPNKVDDANRAESIRRVHEQRKKNNKERRKKFAKFARERAALSEAKNQIKDRTIRDLARHSASVKDNFNDDQFDVCWNELLYNLENSRLCRTPKALLSALPSGLFGQWRGRTRGFENPPVSSFRSIRKPDLAKKMMDNHRISGEFWYPNEIEEENLV